MEKIHHHQRTGGVLVVGVVVGKLPGDLMWREEEEGHAFVLRLSPPGCCPRLG
jgi:hypothetical protein